jgi:hypothetical protein
MSRTERGIYNFYSPMDVPALMLMTTALGTTEGRHTFAAGALGFQVPASLKKQQRAEYTARLFQHSYTLGMVEFGHVGGHFGWTQRALVAKLIAPLLNPASGDQKGPPPTGRIATVGGRDPDTETGS